MTEFGSTEIIGAIVASHVTIMLGAFALIRKILAKPNSLPEGRITPETVMRILHFMDNTDRVLSESSRIQHTQVSYIENLRQELTYLRTEISEMKGRMR